MILAKHKGSCLCQGIQFEVTGDLSSPSACHCTQCRKHTGHYEASTDIKRTQLNFIKGEKFLTWFHTQGKNVRRGFCSVCGSSLFWDPVGRDWTAISMGAFDTPTQTQLIRHIYVNHKGDYYEIKDGLPQESL